MCIQWEFKTRDLDKSGVLEANEIAWMLEEGEGCMIGFLRSCDYDNKKGISQREWEMCFPPTLGGIVILPLVTWGTFFVAKKKKRKEKKKKKKKKKKKTRKFRMECRRWITSGHPEMSKIPTVSFFG